jgi:hypothetical protein
LESSKGLLKRIGVGLILGLAIALVANAFGFLLYTDRQLQVIFGVAIIFGIYPYVLEILKGKK